MQTTPAESGIAQATPTATLPRKVRAWGPRWGPRRLGTEPVEHVECVEDHDAAYDVWKAAGVRDRIVVHFDGHLDFEWIADHSVGELLSVQSSRDLDKLLAEVGVWSLAPGPPRSRITIANFLYPAIKEGVVGELIWVIPDPFWASDQARRGLVRGLRKKLKRRPNESAPLQVSERGITFRVLGCRVTVCTLSALPALAEPVLVDIDVDYLLTSNPTGRPPYFQPEPVSPWLAPSEFLRRLRSAALRTDLVTIAYSVNGGYTLLRHKYFGDLLRQSLRDPSVQIDDVPPGESAAEAYEEACRALEAGNLELMRAAWEKMVRRDASYRTVYAISGWRDETRGAWSSALETYDRMTQVDPDWHVPHVGRGRALWRVGQYEEAEGAFQRACALSEQPTSAMSWLGSCYFRRGDRGAAHRLWSEAVAEDPSDLRSCFCLAVLEARRGDVSSALTHAGRCVAAGYDGPRVRWLLAQTAWRTGKRRLARQEIRTWARVLVQAMWGRAVSRWHRMAPLAWSRDG